MSIKLFDILGYFQEAFSVVKRLLSLKHTQCVVHSDVGDIYGVTGG